MYKKHNTSYISNNPLAFSNFIKDLLPNYSIDFIKESLRTEVRCTNTVRRVIRFNKAINMRTVFCIYNVFILPILKTADEQTKQLYNYKVLKYLNTLNSREHKEFIDVMPIHNLVPNPEYLVSLNASTDTKITALQNNLKRINKSILRLELKKQSNIRALHDLQGANI